MLVYSASLMKTNNNKITNRRILATKKQFLQAKNEFNSYIFLKFKY